SERDATPPGLARERRSGDEVYAPCLRFCASLIYKLPESDVNIVARSGLRRARYPTRRSRARMTRRAWTNILGSVGALTLVIACRPALACEPVSTAVRHVSLAPSASAHALPATIVASAHHSSSHLHHRHHAPHHASLTRDFSAAAPSPLPVHPAGLPHSG